MMDVIGDRSFSVSKWVSIMFNSFSHFPNAINRLHLLWNFIFSAFFPHDYFTSEEEIAERWVEKFQIGVKFVTKEK